MATTFENVFNLDAFFFMLVSMCETIVILSILWAAAHHFAQEDVSRSTRQKKRIIEGSIAGLIFVAIFIVPVLILKYGFDKDFGGQFRPLLLGGYETLMVVLFTWVGFQLLFMYEDGVASGSNMNNASVKNTNNHEHRNNVTENKNDSAKSLSSSKSSKTSIKSTASYELSDLKKPEPAKLNSKTFTADSANQQKTKDQQYHLDLLNSKSMEILFPAEKRGLTFMHLISSWISYFIFLESYLYLMQFNGHQAKSMILPAILSLALVCLIGYAMTALLKKISLTKLFFIAFVIILLSAYHLAHKAVVQFMMFHNYVVQATSSSSENNDNNTWDNSQIQNVANFASFGYWIIIAFGLFVHYKFVKKN